MEKKIRPSVLPYYAAAAVWVVAALFFKLYALSHFLMTAVLSFGALLLGRTLCKDVEVAEPAKEKKKEAEKSSGNPDLDKMMKDGQLAIAEMRRLNEAIEDETISARIDRLEEISQEIFKQVKDDPSKLPQIRKFMDYYLPTTLKLLNTYDRMGATGVAGENISSTMERVEKMMATIVTAFEKQLDSLFGADAMDISTDITVLETMMVREGLAGERMEAETTKNADGTDIKLQL